MRADEPDSSQRRAVDVALDADEVLTLSNALNEVCNGVEIDDFEFRTRIGVEREQARKLLHRLRSLYEASEARAT